MRKASVFSKVLSVLLAFGVTAGGIMLIGRCAETEEETPTCQHEFQDTIAGIAPTCTESGKTAGTICADCGEIIIAQEEIAAKGHTEKELSAVDSTCMETGLTAGKACADCGTVLQAQETVAKKAHTETILPAVEPTCTASGKTAGIACADCGTVLQAQGTVSPLEHNYINGVCVRCEDGTGYIDTLAPTGYMYQKPSYNEIVSGAVYRLGKSSTAIYMSLKSTVANKVFGVYGNHLGEVGTVYETNARFFTDNGYYYVEFPSTDFFVIIDGVKYTDENVVITGIDSIAGVTTTCATRLVRLEDEFALWQTDGANIVKDGSKVTFTGVGAGGLATINKYTNYEITFDVIENSFARTYFAFGLAAPELGSGLVDSAFIQFNYDQLFVTPLGGEQAQYWNQSRSWTISVTDGYLTLITGEGVVVCQNVALGATTGHITLQSAKGCDVTLDNIVITLYK